MVSDIPAQDVTALGSKELAVSSGGVISVSTANNLAIGTHTVTITASLVSYPSNVLASWLFTLLI